MLCHVLSIVIVFVCGRIVSHWVRGCAVAHPIHRAVGGASVRFELGRHKVQLAAVRADRSNVQRVLR